MNTTREAQSVFDCIVVGGGPAGATCATLLAQHGRRVLLFEAAKFPRHHIGESLMPHTYWTFKRLGMLPRLKCSHFPLKESVQFISPTGQESQPFYFWDRDPNEWSITWQVRRDEFDRLMLDNAREHGVQVREGVRVQEVLFDGDRAVGVRAHSDGQTMEYRAGVIVDATGTAGLLSRQLNMRIGDPGLKNGAIYAYWKNAVRDEGRNAGATLVIHTPNRNGWFWFIPLPDEITSIGVVAPPHYLFTGRGDDPLNTLNAEIATTPALSRRLDHAERVSNSYVVSDFTYRSKQMAGNGWVAIGDAFCFLDPIYSSGLMLALKSGELAADSINDALDANDVSAERLGPWGPQFIAGIQRLRQLVYAFYDKNFSFAAFIRSHPEFHDDLTRLLIGDVFDEEAGRIFDVMKDWTKLPGPMDAQSSPSSSAAVVVP
jgi:flavin-dependent dehydrogenase